MALDTDFFASRGLMFGVFQPTVCICDVCSSVIEEITSASWNYTLTMNAYTDAGLSQALRPSDNVSLNEKIWVKLDTDGLEGGFVDLVTDSCWATSQSSPNATPRYDLIRGG